MYRLGVREEATITARMHRLAEEVGAPLVGLEKRLKTPDSFKRKLFMWMIDDDADWSRVLRTASEDLVRFTFLIDPQRYVPAARQVAAALTRDGLALRRIYPAWNVSGHPYRGLNTIWQNAGTGRTFEVQFHTEVSREAVIRARAYYAKERLLPRQHPRAVELRRDMTEIYRWAPAPPGVETITRSPESLIPKPPPAWFDPPADLAARHAVLAGAATGTLTGAGRGR